MTKKQNILCVGEVLWDALPGGLYLGGAPLNVSYHLHQLGENVKILSRVGNDRLGKEALRRIKHLKLATDLIQQDEGLETGFVGVRLDEGGDPDYKFATPVAWDNIQLTNKVQGEVKTAWAMVYGSLALRDKRSRATVFALLKEDTLKVCDINLRRPFYDKKSIEHALRAADILKVNGDELQQLKDWFELPSDDEKAVEAVADIFSCATVTVTQGAKGAVLFHHGQWARHSGYDIAVDDTVGAGDAFLAALLHGLHSGKDTGQLLAFANAAGAYVASRSGAMPEYTVAAIEKMAGSKEVHS